MNASIAVALESSPASRGGTPGCADDVGDDDDRFGEVGADQHVALDRDSEMAELAAGRWWNAAATRHARHRRLHARGHRAAGRDERLELVADLDECVGHRDDDLAIQLLLERMRGGRRAVPRRREHDDVGSGGTFVVGCVDAEIVSGHWAMSPSTASIARYFDREPNVTS